MSARQRKLREQRKRLNARMLVVRLAAVAVATAVLIVALGVGFAYAFVNQSLSDLPDVDAPDAFKVAQVSKMYSADGKLLATFYLENREVVPISRIASDLADAMIAVEDERYYQHQGVDVQGIVRAVAIDIVAGGAKEGASTITQQYVRNTILLSEAREISIRRKLREMWLARELEKRFDKRDILEMYLNTVYFGEGAYGAQAASRHYFGKDAEDLNLAEAAMLAGLPQSPNGLNPYYNWTGAKARQRWVLNRMVATKMVTAKQAEEADQYKIRLHKTTDPDQGIIREHYFVSYARKQLLAQYPDALIFKGGLRIYTTISTKMNKYATRAVKSVLPNRNDPQAALVAIDPRNGFIKAMYGGRNYHKRRYNYATQGRRQPGSSFKVFVLVTALEKGISPSRGVNSSSPMFVPAWHWRVSNSEGAGHGMMSISAATAGSVNCVFARLCLELGPREVARTARRMGITSYIPAYPSIALGSAPVSPLDMASAFGVLAAGGVRHKPTCITKIVDADGNVVYSYKKHGKRVVSKQVAWAATKTLFGVVTGGTGTRAQLPGREVAGKTGTSQNYSDAWFVGYTPQLSTAVWMGYAKGTIPMRNVHGQRAFGGTFCAPIWHNFMVRALARQPKLRFARAGSPKYTWKKGWSKGGESTEKKKTTKKKKSTGGGGGGGGGGGEEPPPPPPVDPEPPPVEPPTTSTVPPWPGWIVVR